MGVNYASSSDDGYEVHEFEEEAADEDASEEGGIQEDEAFTRRRTTTTTTTTTMAMMIRIYNPICRFEMSIQTTKTCITMNRCFFVIHGI